MNNSNSSDLVRHHFDDARKPEKMRGDILSKDKGSQMVQRTNLGLNEGPTPPRGVFASVKREQFNKDWRAEYRASLKRDQGRRMVQSFTQNAARQRSI